MIALDKRTFYRRWAQKTFSRTLWITGLINLFVGIVSTFATDEWPAFAWLWTRLPWTIPVTVFVGFFFYRFFVAPYEIAHELDDRCDRLAFEIFEMRGRLEAKANVISQSLRLAIAEIEQNIPKRGAASKVILSEHLRTFIGLAETQDVPGMTPELLKQLYALRDRTDVQRSFESLQTASRHHENNYLPLAEEVVSALRKLQGSSEQIRGV